MNEILAQIGWSKVFFAQKVGVPEATVRDWCGGRTQGNSYKVAMAYLQLVKRLLSG